MNVMIRYISTRGPGDPKTFLDVMMAGLSPDGGLYVPDSWPEFDHDILSHLTGTPYTNIAANIMAPFMGRTMTADALQRILAETYEGGAFDHSAIAPLVQVGPNAWLLELFHGPTLSFKDYALQFIGRLFDQILEQKSQKLTVIGATSGDTGSAAIEALRHCKNITTIILHPKDRTSDVQRRQMTTVDAENVHNLAIDGTFDDCQALVKAMLGNSALQQELRLSAVNSINWARIMAQVVYYVAAAVALGAPDRPVSFTVPTGNFGNIYAGWVARRIGLPIHRLTMATNRNDILTRFFETGEMRVDKVMPSLSPSMDIQVSSNFERYLFDLLRRDHDGLGRLMLHMTTRKAFSVGPDFLKQAHQEFSAERCSDSETLDMMRSCYEETGILIDPHTAVGLHAAYRTQDDPSIPSVILACAHPAKFPEAVQQATGIRPELPGRLADLMDRAEHYTAMPNDLQRVIAFVRAETPKS
jgi:threonine synthase